MVVVFVKRFAQLESIFPAIGYTHDNPKLFEHLDRAVHAGPIYGGAASDELGHGEASVVL